MRRQSLAEEIKDKNVAYADSRVSTVLNSLPDKARQDIMGEYERRNSRPYSSASQQQQQHQPTSKERYLMGLAKVIDAFFERNNIQNVVSGQVNIRALNQTLNNPPSQQQQQPYHVSALSASASANSLKTKPIPQGGISSPTQMDPNLVSDTGVGDYRFLRTLGKGTFGKVKLAEHIVTKEQVAIKIIERANIKTTKQRVSVDREVRLMKLLHHPHIVGVIDVYESDHFIWIVMENACGGELFDHIVSNGRIKEPEAKRFFRQILSAVEYCHQNSVIHRDLKPENLLLDDKLNIKIIDFGFGNTFHRDRYLDTYCGSPFYAAPEMIRGIRYIGPEVDVWSLGVILYAILSGRLPFDATSMNELYEKIAKGKYSCPSHFSQEAVHLISRMLVTDPKKRATLTEIKQHPWVTDNNKYPVESYVPERSRIVVNSNSDSVAELVSYGFQKDDIDKILRTEMNLHPIVSLYHLIDEARRRKLAGISPVYGVGYQIHPKPVYAMQIAGYQTGDDQKSSSGIAAHWNRLTRSIKKDEQSANNDVHRSRRSTNPNQPARMDQQQIQQHGHPTVSLSHIVASSEQRPSTTQGLAAHQMQNKTNDTASTLNNTLLPTRNSYSTVVTTKSLREIMLELQRVLNNHKILFAKASEMSFTCDDHGCRFVVEITNKDPNTGLFEVKFRKIQSFWSWNHKAVFSKITNDLQL